MGPGSYSASRGSYADSSDASRADAEIVGDFTPGASPTGDTEALPRQPDFCRFSWTIFSSQGRKLLKLLAARAVTHSAWGQGGGLREFLHESSRQPDLAIISAKVAHERSRQRCYRPLLPSLSLRQLRFALRPADRSHVHVEAQPTRPSGRLDGQPRLRAYKSVRPNSRWPNKMP